MDKGLSATVTRRLGRTMRNYASGSKSAQPTEGMATFVRRDQDGTCWVRLPGADIDTPVNGSVLVSAESGQTVSYRIDGTRLTVTGNASDPAIGTNGVSKAISESSNSLSRLFKTGINKVFADVSKDIISIINSAASGGTIDVSKLSLSSYSTTSQVSTLISNAISSAFDLLDSNSYVYKLVNNVIEPAIDIAISVAEGVLNSNIESAVSAIDIGGRNLLNNTGWDSSDSLKLTSSNTDYGAWYRTSPTAYFTYDSGTGLMSILTSATSNNRFGYRQRVNVESSTTYVLSAEVGDSYHIGIGTSSTPADSGGWTADGTRVWKTYTTGSSETSLYVFMYAQGGSTPSPCKLNHVMLEKANKPSEWDFNEYDFKYVTGVIQETADSAYDIADNLSTVVDGLPDVVSGTVGQSESISGGGYRDYTVSFDETFSTAPVVVLTVYSTSTATTFDCDIYLRSVSTTGFTARIFNRETNNARSPGFHWQAVGELES